MKNLFSFIVAAALLTACGDSGKDASGKLTSFDACSCATVKDQASDDFKKCKELRDADPKFESDFQSCAFAQRSGLDPSKVTLQNSENATNLKSASNGTFVFDAGSALKWKGEKATGKEHKGTVNVKSGSFTMQDSGIASGEIVIDMGTITTTDLTDDSKTKLETHLKSADFFDVAKHGEARFVVKSATAKSPQQYEVLGSLTIKGITKDATANVVIAPSLNNAVLAGSILFDRSQFDVRYGSDTFFDNLGDDMIKDNVILTFDLRATKQ